MSSLSVESIVELDGMTVTVRIEGERLLAHGDTTHCAIRAAERAYAATRAALDPTQVAVLNRPDLGP